jgi:ATP-dependent DNA helicase RecG
MTATPIPRTIALTLYGDLELSTLKELPKGRIPIVTKIVSPNKRDDAYKWIKVRINKYGEQVFVVCPIIEESESEVMKQVKAAKVEFEKLKKIFPENRLRLLHGKLGVKEKDKAIEHFRNQKCDILVTTPVVEVGIDIPNATIMIIEAAERFGLAQLHQLRGRVGRGSKKSYCLLFTNTRSKNVNTRLNALQKTLSGFELAELDLKLRGPGEIIGTKQHGFTELKIASWNDSILIKKSKEVADEILRDKKYMSKYAKYLGLNDVLPN